MQINSVNNVSFKGALLFDSTKAARKAINTGKDELINIAEQGFSSAKGNFLVATGEDASVYRTAMRTSLDAARNTLKGLIAKAENKISGKYTDVI